jgi:hypothetical protein
MISASHWAVVVVVELRMDGSGPTRRETVNSSGGDRRCASQEK